MTPAPVPGTYRTGPTRRSRKRRQSSVGRFRSRCSRGTSGPASTGRSWGRPRQGEKGLYCVNPVRSSHRSGERAGGGGQPSPIQIPLEKRPAAPRQQKTGPAEIAPRPKCPQQEVVFPAIFAFGRGENTVAVRRVRLYKTRAVHRFIRGSGAGGTAFPPLNFSPPPSPNGRFANPPTSRGACARRRRHGAISALTKAFSFFQSTMPPVSPNSTIICWRSRLIAAFLFSSYSPASRSRASVIFW